MDTIFNIATKISTPLSLAGLFACIFFFIIREIISRNILPVPTNHRSIDIIKLIIDRLFVLSLAALVLGFAGFVIDHNFNNVREPNNLMSGVTSKNATQDRINIEGYIHKVFVVNLNSKIQILPERARLRERPDINSKTILILPKGQHFKIINTMGNWVKIETENSKQ
mgnify:CR=1 FL=1